MEDIFAKDRILPDCIRAAIKNENIIVRNPNSVRPYQQVFEALSAYLMITQKQYNDKSFEGNYNIGPDEDGCIKTREIVDLFCNLWGNINWKNKNEDSNFHESNILKLDCSKIKNTIGWKSKLTIYEAIKLTIDWSKEYYSNGNINEISRKQIMEYFT